MLILPGSRLCGSRFYYQELRRIGVLKDQFTIFLLQAALEAAQVTRFWNVVRIQWYGIYQVIAYVHHQLHTGAYRTKKVFFL